jgi:nitrate reductase cytochrome c-type subunit
MILNPSAKKTGLKIMTLLLVIFCSSAIASEIINLPKDKHRYTSYTQFARSNCLPCHFRNISNGTDLSIIFSHFSKQQLKEYLSPILKNGDMPPDNALREILYSKFLGIK